MRASVVVGRDRIEEATARMLELFPEGFAEEQLGDDVELVAFTDDAGAGRLRESFGRATSVPVAAGWEEEWKRFHVPAVVGSLWVGPPWAQSPAGLLPVVIDPGLAFGTGAHPTTQLCIEALHGLERGTVLDLGCGSGVIAIAAATLGFTPVTAIDSDEAAIEATTRNARANGVRLDVRRVDALTEALPEAEIVIANIDLPTLAGLRPPRGCEKLVTSGYYEPRRPSFRGFERVDRRVRAHWAADLFARQ